MIENLIISGFWKIAQDLAYFAALMTMQFYAL